MEVLNDLSSHKQYLFDHMESGFELKGLDSFWDPALVHILEPQASTFLPVATRCGSTLEALSRTGSPNGSLLNEAVLKHDLLHHPNTKNSSTVWPLSCHPHIKKCSKRGWTPSTTHALKKELECLLSESPIDELVYPNGSPFLMDHSLKMDPGHMYADNKVSGGIILKDQLYENSSSKQSFEDSDLAYAYTKSPAEDSTTISLASSQNSTSNNLLGSSEILHPVLFDQSTMLEYATHGLETWFEDPFSNIAILQTYTDDGNFINYPKKEEPMVNDKGKHLSYGFKAAHSQGFLAHTECQQGNNSSVIALNEGIEVPDHLRIDFEDNFVQLHNLAQEGSQTSGCTQFCLPKSILGPLHSNNTTQKLHATHDGFSGRLSICTGAAENKPLSKHTDGRPLNKMYEDPSVKSYCTYASEDGKAKQNLKSVKNEDSLDVGKTREWVSNASNVCAQFDVRLKSNHTEIGLVHLLTAGAEAVARRDMDLASVILVRLKDMVSCLGNTMQRVVAYFIQGLEHQIQGVKRVDQVSNIKSQGDILAAFQILHEIFPYIKFGHFTANQAILEAVQGVNRVHIVDFEIMEGIQWPALMQALVSRKGGPPDLHITALCRPHWEHGLAMVQKTGKRLSEFASALGLPFSFNILKTEHDEGFNANKLKFVEGEALVVNCMVHLPHMPRRSMASVVSFLQGMHMLSPTIITLVEEELGCNTTPVASYFSEALYHFHAICDSLEACLPAEVEARMLVERIFMAPRIDNVVAMWSRTMSPCSVHGMEVSDKYKWSTVMHSAGFKPLPLSCHSQSQAKLLLGLHRDGFNLEEQSHYLVLGWQSKPLFAASVWS